MVTRTVVRISPEERAAAAAAVEESSRDDGRTDYDDKHDICETIQICSFQGCQNRVATGGICDGHSHHDLFYDCIPNGGTSDEEKDEESCGHNNTACKKRPSLNNDDAGDTKKKKRRKGVNKFIDLTDVPTQQPILKSEGKSGHSKYQGVTTRNDGKWMAQIMVDGKNYNIGYYDNEEEAAVDYARALFKYRSENIQTGKLKVERDLLKSCQTESQHEAVLVDHKQKESDTNPTPLLSVSDKASFPLRLANKDGRIGIYLPDERKARLARFHAKRSNRVFKRRVVYDVRKKIADSKPRFQGRFATKSVVCGR